MNLFNTKFEVGVIIGSEYCASGEPSKVTGFYMKWHPQVLNIVSGKRASPVLYAGVFKYWSLVYPGHEVADRIVWTDYYRNRKVTTCTYFKDGTFIFEVNGWFLHKKRLKGGRLQSLLKDKDLLRNILHKEFSKEYLRGKLVSTFEYMPKDILNASQVKRAQMLMFYSEDQLLEMLLQGKKFDAGPKVQNVLTKMKVFAHALLEFAPKEDPPGRLLLK